MERIWIISAIIWAIIGLIGFVMLILYSGSTPQWMPFISLGIGILGMMGSWMSIFLGATRSLQLQTIKLQRRTIEILEEFEKRAIAILEEIRERLSH